MRNQTQPKSCEREEAQNRRTHHYQVLLASIPSVRDIIEAPLGSNKLKWSPQFILHTYTLGTTHTKQLKVCTL